jgi:diacylglycerol kinase family enzyme
MPGIGLISNPESRANRRDPARREELAYLLGNRGAARETRTLDDLYRTAEEFKAADIDLLCINGGDGTIHVTLTAFLTVYGSSPLPRVAILRGGTMNTIAEGLGITGTPEDILFRILERYHRGLDLVCVERHVMRVEDRYGFLFGNGLISNFMQAYYDTGRPSPQIGALLVGRTVGSTLFGTPFAQRVLHRFHGQVTVDANVWEQRDFLTIAAATVPQLGLGFTPFSHCTQRPNHFAVIGIFCEPMGLVRELWRVYRGQPMGEDKCVTTVARHMTLESDEEFPYIVDGEVYRSKGRLVIETGPLLAIVHP